MTPTTSDPILDQLVPAPWGPTRRLAAAAVVTVIAVALGALWWSGVLGVNLAPVRGYGYGALDGTVGTTDAGAARGVVELHLDVVNRGLRPVEDLTIAAPPFNRAALTQPGGPVDIAPRSERQVTLHLAIDDCSRFQAAPWPGLHVQARSGPMSSGGTELRVLGADDSRVRPTWSDAREPDVASWWYGVAQPVCDPDAMHAP